MKLSINEGYFRKKPDGTRRTPEESITICKNGGFDTIDFGLGYKTSEENIILRSDYKGEAEKIRNFCDGVGVDIDQTHARYDYLNYNSKSDFISDMLKTVETSKILGANTVVVHADTYYDENYRFDFDTVLEEVYSVFAPMVDHAAKYGVKIAMETLFDAEAGPRTRFCSKIEELEAIVGRFCDKTVGICWDFGHVRVSYGDDRPKDLERLCDKIIATHVHDSLYGKDTHLLPYFGLTDWNTILPILGKCGYDGTFTYELVYGCQPEELLPDFVKIYNKTGKYMINKILEAR